MSTNSKEYSREHKRKQRLKDGFLEKEYERNRIWRSENSKHISEHKKQYRLLNKDELIERGRKNHLERKKRTMQWNKELTNFVKLEARDLVKKRKIQTKIRWSIDHEIPLKGKLVSGLDVWNNIKVIPLIENNRKYNNYEVSS